MPKRPSSTSSQQPRVTGIENRGDQGRIVLFSVSSVVYLFFNHGAHGEHGDDHQAQPQPPAPSASPTRCSPPTTRSCTSATARRPSSTSSQRPKVTGIGDRSDQGKLNLSHRSHGYNCNKAASAALFCRHRPALQGWCMGDKPTTPSPFQRASRSWFKGA